MNDRYFVVLDKAPTRGAPVGEYALMFGDPETAIGVQRAAGPTIYKLLDQHVPKDEPVYRVFLQRTDGHGGVKLIKRRLS